MIALNMNLPIKGRGFLGLALLGAAMLVAPQALAATVIAGPSGSCSGTCSISQSSGSLSGSNLFHSFTKFSIGSGDTVTFAAAPATTINNLFTRVTGGVRSTIEGTLSLEAGAGSRNFYLINPAGVTFGAGATIDVPGAFHASTADYIKFPDGNFYADTTRTSTLSSAPPEAFGFLGTNRGMRDLAGAVLSTSGTLDLVAGDITIDGGGWGDGISNTTGDVRLVAVGNQTLEVPLTGTVTGMRGDLQIVNGGVVETWTDTISKAGNLFVSAGTLSILGTGGRSKLQSTTDVDSGDAGNVSVVVTGPVVLDYGFLRSDTKWHGNAGNVSLSAGSLALGNSSWISSDSLGDGFGWGLGKGGNIMVTVSGHTSISSGSWISSDAYADGNAGSVNVTTGTLRIDGSMARSGISSEADVGGNSGFGQGGGVIVNVTGGDAVLVEGGRISTNASGPGDAGTVTVNVSAGNLIIDGRGLVDPTTSDGQTGIFSSTGTSSLGDAGPVTVSVRGALEIKNGGNISTTAKGIDYGSAGAIDVTAASLLIDGVYSDGDGTGIFSQAKSDLGGNSGSVTLRVRDNLSIMNDGAISTSTWAGDAGVIVITAGSIDIANNSGIFSKANYAPGLVSIGDAGLIDITATGHVSIANGSNISSDTTSVGNAGSVQVSAGSLTMDGMGSGGYTGIFSDANSGSSGDAGNVDVTVAGALKIFNGAWISSDTYDVGNAGSVSVRAGSLAIDRQGNDRVTGISSDAIYNIYYVTGNAGNIDVTVAGQLSILNGGRISSLTEGEGVAGHVDVSAGNLLLSGKYSWYRSGVLYDSPSSIDASAGVISSGQTGSVTVNVAGTTTLQNSAEISIKNYATVADPTVLFPTTLTITSPNLTLSNSAITAASTGNVSASNITVNVRDTLHLDPSQITTSANLGNGGSIFINGGRLVWLDNSQITTSVAGLTGNGGDIHITADNLVLSTGFIQANTAATNALGGNIVLNIGALIPSGGILYVGGDTPYRFQPYIFGYNVIQAAAPDGVSGAIEITSPTIDLSGSLAGLSTRVLDSGGLGRNPCRTGGSSLGVVGRGGLPSPTSGPLRIDETPERGAAGASAGSFKLAALGCGI